MNRKQRGRVSYHLETAQSISAKDATEDDVSRAFDDESGFGEFVILTSSSGTILQAGGGDDDQYVLEYGDDNEVQFRADGEFSKKQVRVAFLAFVRGDESWRTTHTWKPLERSRAGCFSAIVLLAWIVFSVAA